MKQSIIVSCGNKKTTTKAKAQYLYIGSYFKMNLKWAKKHSPESDIFILSAKYGLLKLNTVIMPYNIKMGQVGSITINDIKQQAIELGILDNNIIALGGKIYIDKLMSIFKNIIIPFKGLKFGYTMQAIKRDLDK